MATGKKRHRITIQHRRQTKSGYGEVIEVWTDGVTVWASFEPLRGNEYFKSSAMPQTLAEIDTRMRIRPLAGLDPANNRIIHKGIVYDLVSVLPDNRGIETQLMVKARALDQINGGAVNP